MKYLEQLEPNEIAIISEKKGIIHIPLTIENIKKKAKTGFLEIDINISLDSIIKDNFDVVCLFLGDFEPTVQKYLEWSSKSKIYLTTYDT